MNRILVVTRPAWLAIAALLCLAIVALVTAPQAKGNGQEARDRLTSDAIAALAAGGKASPDCLRHLDLYPDVEDDVDVERQVASIGDGGGETGKGAWYGRPEELAGHLGGDLVGTAGDLAFVLTERDGGREARGFERLQAKGADSKGVWYLVQVISPAACP